MSSIRDAVTPLIRSALRAAAGGLWLVLVLGGCGRDETPQAGVAQSEKAPADPVEGPPRAKYVEDSFIVELSGPSAIGIGERASFVVTLRAGSGYKVNPEYPHKLRLKEASGLTFAQRVVDASSANVSKDAATFPIAVEATAPGAHKVAGQLAFSVCTPEKCLMERRELEVDTVAR